jgi:hypothetical protein
MLLDQKHKFARGGWKGRVGPALRELMEVLKELPDHPMLFPGDTAELLRRLHSYEFAFESLKEELPAKRDLFKDLCASVAYEIFIENSTKVPTGTVDGPYRTVTCLLYELVTGRRNKDLKKACDRQLAAARPAEARHQRRRGSVRAKSSKSTSTHFKV